MARADRAPKVDPGAALLALDALDLRDRLASGALRAVELARACLDRVRAIEGDIHAFAWLDEAHVMAEAERLDRLRKTGQPIGLLHGLPIGVKDIIDTRGIPTENGTPIDAGRVPAEDACVVRRLRAAGGYVFGKTVTAELASMHPGATANPHDPARTPGGSSQGSAAAVSAGMIPLAIGTQTGGSVIRPASFCGVVGFKPSFGTIARTGVLSQSPGLDTVGVFATSEAGAALLADAIWGDDPGDPATAPAPAPRLLDIARSDPPVRPTLALLADLPGAELDPEMSDAMAEIARILGDDAFAIALPDAFAQAAEMRAVINEAEMAKAFFRYEKRGAEALSDSMNAALDRGRAILARDYLAALDWPRLLNSALDEIFARCDAILCPAALGPAPIGLDTTGDPICNGLWTLCGTPAITLPLLWSSEGMPMGLQLVGRRGDDARLLRTARWLRGRLADTEGAPRP